MSPADAELREQVAALTRRLEELAGFVGALEHGLEGVQDRLEQLAAQLEAVDASFVRHQAQNEDDFGRAEQAVDRVGHQVDEHEWRSHR